MLLGYLRKSLVLAGLSFAAFGVSVLTADAAPTPVLPQGVLTYDPAVTPPEGFVTLVDNVESPSYMVFMRRNVYEGPYEGDFSYEDFLNFELNANEFIPTKALTEVLAGSGIWNQRYVLGEDALYDAYDPEWVNDPAFYDQEGDNDYYDAFRVNNEGDGYGFTISTGSSFIGGIAGIRTIYIPQTPFTWCEIYSGDYNIPYSECVGLAYLYTETDGDNRESNNGWFDDLDVSSREGDYRDERDAIDLVDIDGISHIESIYLYDNNLSGSIITGLSMFPYIENISLEENNLSHVTVKNLQLLKYLDIEDNNWNEDDEGGFIDIYLENLPALTELDLSDNNYVTINDLSAFPTLEDLYLDDNGLTGGDLDSFNIYALTGLRDLDLDGNELTGTFDATAFTVLEYLDISDNEVTAIDTHGLSVLSNIDFEENLVTYFDFSLNTGLVYIDGSDNDLTGINLSGLSVLEDIDVSNNELTQLVLNNLPQLEEVYAEYNSLTGIQLSGVANLSYLYLNNNYLTQIDLSGAPHLQYVYISYNQLSSIDLSHNTGLSDVSLEGNLLSDIAFSDVEGAYESLSLSVNYNSLCGLSEEENAFIDMYTQNDGWRSYQYFCPALFSSAESQGTSIVVTWTPAPSSAADEEPSQNVLGYELTRSGLSGSYELSGDVYTFTATELMSGEEYTFELCTIHSNEGPNIIVCDTITATAGQAVTNTGGNYGGGNNGGSSSSGRGSSGGGGGGGSSYSSSTTTTSSNTGTTTTGTVATGSTSTGNTSTGSSEPQNESTEDTASEDTTPTTAGGTSYDTETMDAYTFARTNGITTINSLEAADPFGLLYRRDAAKMFVMFAKLIGKTAVVHETCSFSDTGTVDAELQGYIVEACRLGLMGLKADGSIAPKFNPNAQVPRAEFGTILSRMLYGDKYNSDNADDANRYAAHLEALKAAGIMKVINLPWEIEKRTYAWIMLQRVAEMMQDETADTPQEASETETGASVPSTGTTAMMSGESMLTGGTATPTTGNVTTGSVSSGSATESGSTSSSVIVSG